MIPLRKLAGTEQQTPGLTKKKKRTRREKGGGSKLFQWGRRCLTGVLWRDSASPSGKKKRRESDRARGMSGAREIEKKGKSHRGA